MGSTCNYKFINCNINLAQWSYKVVASMDWLMSKSIEGLYVIIRDGGQSTIRSAKELLAKDGTLNVHISGTVSNNEFIPESGRVPSDQLKSYWQRMNLFFAESAFDLHPGSWLSPASLFALFAVKTAQHSGRVRRSWPHNAPAVGDSGHAVRRSRTVDDAIRRRLRASLETIGDGGRRPLCLFTRRSPARSETAPAVMTAGGPWQRRPCVAFPCPAATPVVYPYVGRRQAVLCDRSDHRIREWRIWVDPEPRGQAPWI
nr:hypothetical protein Iba_chr04fCG12050 [Ipomoea batatas]